MGSEDIKSFKMGEGYSYSDIIILMLILVVSFIKFVEYCLYG